MWHLLSFYGRWDPSFFEGEPVPQHLDEHADIKKRHTCAAIEARAKLKLARKYELRRKGSLLPDQEQLVASLHDGTLEAEVHRLALLSGNGRLRGQDGTFVDIGGSRGGFMRAVLYDWTPPNGEGKWQ